MILGLDNYEIIRCFLKEYLAIHWASIFLDFFDFEPKIVYYLLLSANDVNEPEDDHAFLRCRTQQEQNRAINIASIG